MYPHTHMHKHTHTRTHTTESDDAFEDAGNSSPEEDELGERWNPDCELKRERGREMAGSWALALYVCSSYLAHHISFSCW